MNLGLDVIAQSTLMLFIIVDPVGNAPLFYWLTLDIDRNTRRRIVRRSVALASGLLILFALIGDALFKYFGMTLSDFKIAGGIVLFIYGLEGVLGRTEVSYIERGEYESLAVVPMAVPLLAGPGAIATVIYIKFSFGLLPALIAVVINTLISLPLLQHGSELLDLLGKNGSLILARLMAMLLLGVSTAIIREGVEEIVASMSA